jgi:hypothetical protein
MNMLTPDPPTGRDRPTMAGPHLSGPAGWGILMAFLGTTLLGLVLYLVRLAEAST